MEHACSRLVRGRHAKRVVAENPFDPDDADAQNRAADLVLSTAAEAEERDEIPVGDYFFADVFVTMSESVVQLPRNVFDGERDAQWEFDPTQVVRSR